MARNAPWPKQAPEDRKLRRLMESIPYETTNEVLYGSIRKIVLERSGIIDALSILSPYDNHRRQTTSSVVVLSANCRQDLLRLLATVVLESSASATVHALDAKKPEVSTFVMDRSRLLETLGVVGQPSRSPYYPPQPLSTIPSFTGFVFPDWDRRRDVSLDESVAGRAEMPIRKGLPQKDLRCAIQTAFAVILCSSAFRRRMDQRNYADLVTLRPLAQMTYAIQVQDWQNLTQQEIVDRSDFLFNNLDLANGKLAAPMAIHDVFGAMFHGVASFSFSTSNVLVCEACKKRIPEEKPNRSVNRNIIHVSRTDSTCHSTITRLFQPAKRKASAQLCELDDDGGIQNESTIIQPTSGSCAECHGMLDRRQVLIDRLPYFLTLGFDRSRSGTKEPPIRLPGDWKDDITIEDIPLVKNNVLSSTRKAVYGLAGGIRCAISQGSEPHYTTLWKDSSSSEDVWLEYDGMTAHPERGQAAYRKVEESEAFTNFDSEDLRSVANLLVYKQSSRK